MKKLSLILITLALILSGCRKAAPPEPAVSSKPVIVCTIGMIADVVTHVAGEHYNVIGLMGPGIDPHLYKATMGDIKAINEAEVIFYNGLHLEARMGDILKDIGDEKPSVAVTRELDPAGLLSPPEFEGNHDPHVWFDVTMWISAVEVIRTTLVEHAPAQAEDFNNNAGAYTQKLMELDQYVTDRLGAIPQNQRVLVTAHDAFGYFGRKYDFEVKGLQGISTVAEAGVSDVQDLVNYIADRKIPAIFIESSVPRKSIEAVQEAVKKKGWKVTIGGELFSDAMGDAATPEGTYIGMVRHNVDTIASALMGDAKHEPAH